MGRVGDRVAVRVAKPLRKPHTTFAMFEKADESTQTDGGAVSNDLGIDDREPGRDPAAAHDPSIACVLNDRLKRLKADEQSLQATIAELITATEIAERAIAGLKATVREGDADAGRAPAARPSSSPPSSTQQLAAGARGAQPARADRRRAADGRPSPSRSAPPPDAKAIAAAAQAFAERARARASSGLAA